MRTAAFLLYLFAAVIFMSHALADAETINIAWGFMLAAIASALYVID